MCSTYDDGEDVLFNYYANQYADSEEYLITTYSKHTLCKLNYHPVQSCTVTGAVYIGDKKVQTFIDDGDGLTFKDVDNIKSGPKINTGYIDYKTGTVYISWDRNTVMNAKLVFSYEYPCGQFDLCDHSCVDDLMNNANTKSTWNFINALGDTIKEKYESLYVKINDISNVIIRKGGKGLFFIVAPSQLCSIIETTYLFRPNAGVYSEQEPMGIELPTKEIGVLNRKWRIYKDNKMPFDKMLIGDDYKQPSQCAVLTVKNFVI